MVSSDKINQLQLLQQNLQSLSQQKQQMQEQLVELDSALNEVKSTEKAYKIVGKIMIATSKDSLQKDLEQKKEVAEIRLKNFTKQEDALQQSMKDIQKQVMEELKKKKEK